jgi:hypothetical protein
MRYFFDLFETGNAEIRDEEGADCIDLDAAKAEALRRYAIHIAECAERGSLDPAIGVAVRDERGGIVTKAVAHVSWVDTADRPATEG